MKKIVFILSFLPFAAFSQIIPTVGIGASVTHDNQHAMAEIGYQLGHAYLGAETRFNSQGYAALQVSPIAGITGHWNNGKGHELTTMAFVKYEVPAYVPGKQDVKPIIAFGVRHWVYNAMFQGTYSAGQISLTFGWSFANPFH